MAGRRERAGQQPPADIVLASLATIRANFDYGSKSYLDNFVPFALDAVRHGGQQTYSDTDVAHHIWRRFGLSITPRVVAPIPRRAVRQKFGSCKDNRFALAEDIDAKLPDVGSQQEARKREQAALVEGLVRYAQSLDAPLTPEAAEAALLDYVEAHAVPLLAHEVRGGTYVENDFVEQNRPATSYVVAAYVRGSRCRTRWRSSS